MAKDNTILGIIGLPGSGKTTVSKYLQTQGFSTYTLSDFIKLDLIKSGIHEFSRELLQSHGNKMRVSVGPEVLAKKALSAMKKDKSKKAIIDGIRNVNEVKFLFGISGFTLLSIRSAQRSRYERIKHLKGVAWVGTYTNFQEQEKREKALGSKKSGLRVHDCMRLAQYTIKNDGSRLDLYKEIDNTLKEIIHE